MINNIADHLCVRSHAKLFLCIISVNSQKDFRGRFVIPILQMMKLKFIETNLLGVTQLVVIAEIELKCRSS